MEGLTSFNFPRDERAKRDLPDPDTMKVVESFMLVLLEVIKGYSSIN
jgi:hypothetical protein